MSIVGDLKARATVFTFFILKLKLFMETQWKQLSTHIFFLKYSFRILIFLGYAPHRPIILIEFHRRLDPYQEVEFHKDFDLKLCFTITDSLNLLIKVNTHYTASIIYIYNHSTIELSIGNGRSTILNNTSFYRHNAKWITQLEFFELPTKNQSRNKTVAVAVKHKWNYDIMRGNK